MTHPKRALVISYYFAPQNAIGAVRPTKFAKYLTRMGWEVTVLCGWGMNASKDPTLEKDSRELHDVRVIREWNPLRRYKERQGGAATATGAAGTAAKPERESAGGGGLKRRLLNGLYLYLWVLSDRSFQRKAKRELKRLEGTFDAVFSTYAPLSVHEIALAAKKRGLAKRWVADFRDEVGVSFDWMKGYQRRYMAMLRQNADVLCAVSNGFLDMMGLREAGRWLSNGFDLEDAAGLTPLPPKPEEAFRLVYCGHLREGRDHVKNRDIRPAFQALRQLIDEGVIRPEQLRLVYAGDESGLFTAYAAQYGLESRVKDHGRVSREASLRLQAGADMLLMASWNLTGQTGILTGKLFEYMLMDKPILCCMAGDLAQSELKRVLTQTGMGFCCEQAAGESDQRALKQYLYETLSLWKQAKPLLTSKKDKEWKQYAYPVLTAQLAQWLEG